MDSLIKATIAGGGNLLVTIVTVDSVNADITVLVYFRVETSGWMH